MVSRVLASVARCWLYLALLQVMTRDEFTADAQEPVPYLLFTTQRAIHRLFLNGSTVEQLLTPAQFGVMKIDYHYELNYMFWIDATFNQPQIMRARLDGSELTAIATGDLVNPVDLAVDWLNDNIYWLDTGLRRIEEYNIATGNRRVVVSTGNEGETLPLALALYPYPNYGWLYWSDSSSESIEMVSVTGDDRSTFHGGVTCAKALSVDYSDHTLYWIDQCRYEIEALRLDGDASTHVYPFDTAIFFPSALASYNNELYWSAAQGIYKANRDSGEVEQVYRISGTRGTGVQVVHPSNQPPADEYEDIVNTVDESVTFQCSLECVHGECIFPGLCACDAGWRGEQCDTDKEECGEGNGGCQYSCTELVGSFQCHCPDGFTLAENQRNCIDLNECEDPADQCQQRCVNNEGSYSCDCFTGYIMDQDGVTCNAIECTGTTVTRYVTPPPTAVFDPCIVYISETTTTSSTSSSTLAVHSSSSVSVSSTTSSVLTHSSMLQSSSRLSSVHPTSSAHYYSTVLSGISESSSSVLSGISETSSTVLSSTSSNVVGMDTVKSSSVPVTHVTSSLSPTQSNSEVTTSTFTAVAVDHMTVEATSTRGAVVMTSQQDTMIGPSSTRVSRASSSVNVGVMPTPTPSYSSKVISSNLPTGTGSSDGSVSKKPTTTSTEIPFPGITEANTEEGKGLDLFLVAGIGGGVAFLIILIVVLLLILCLVCACQRRRSGSWTPPDHNKTESGNGHVVESTSMKPVTNGHSLDSNVTPGLSKHMESDLDRADLDHADLDRADLDHADLDHADLDHADLDRTDLDLPDLNLADLDLNIALPPRINNHYV